ncbi:MAG: hypothetical protein II063_10415 [Prevotella sp.]|nr:hypothetical protein [Prevotella sp.]
MRISDVFWFLQGYARYWMVKMFGFGVLREHIGEQIVSRAMSADKRCLVGGECIICGCHTPALFYAGKSCDKPCYPRMMGRKKWEMFKEMEGDEDWHYVKHRFYKVKEVIDEGIQE